jgi:hypothetical protein
VSAKTVGELRKVTAWPETLAVTTPQERHADSAGYKAKSIAALQLALGSLLDKMRVEVEPDTHKGLLLISVPPTVGLVGDSLQPHSHAGERPRSLGWHSRPADHMSARQVPRDRIQIQDRATCVFPSQKDGAVAGRCPQSGPYQIVQRLPAAEDGEFHYEIRSAVEAHNRVARESELTRA